MQKLGMHHESIDDFYHPKLNYEHPLALQILYRLSKAEFINQGSIHG